MCGESRSRGGSGRGIVMLGCWLAMAGMLLLSPGAGAQSTPVAPVCVPPTPVATMVPGDGTGGSVPAATPAPVGLATPVVTDCLRVTLKLDKLEAGPRVLTLTVTDARGKPVSDATVTVQTQSLAMNHGISSYTATKSRTGVYVARDVSLGMSGAWQVNVFITRPNIGRAEAVFVFSLTGPKM